MHKLLFQRETLASRTSHLKDGLNRLFCLVPYDVITPDIWDYVMPHWMEAMVNDVPEHELHELKMILWYVSSKHGEIFRYLKIYL